MELDLPVEKVTAPLWKRPWQQLGLAGMRCARPHCGNRSVSLGGILRRSEPVTLNSGQWYCGPQCLQAALAEQFDFAVFDLRRQPILTRMPLGLLLLSRDAITDGQLRDALQLHKSTGRRIGECLCSTGAATEDDVVSAISVQWACPVFGAANVQPGCAALVPAALLRRHQMLPVHFTASSRNLYIAFASQVSHSALYAVEQMLHCHTEPCVVADRVLSRGIERRCASSENELTLERTDSGAEMARIVMGHALRLAAEEVRYVVCDRDLWVRVIGRRGFADLVFLENQPSD